MWETVGVRRCGCGCLSASGGTAPQPGPVSRTAPVVPGADRPPRRAKPAACRAGTGRTTAGRWRQLALLYPMVTALLLLYPVTRVGSLPTARNDTYISTTGNGTVVAVPDNAKVVDVPDNATLLTRTQFLQRLLDGYDSRVPPNFDDNTATQVAVDMFISSFDTISETTMDYMVSIFMRQMWHDRRLAYHHLTQESVLSLDARLADALWLPDLFFTNEKKAYFHEVTKPNRFIRLYRNGTVYYSMRISLTLSCPMKLHKFPMDTQVCSLQMESYAYTLDKMMLTWRGKDAVEFNNELELPQFKLSGFSLKDCTKHYHTGSFTCLQVDFVLKRDIGFYMIQTYIPSALVVILSWVSFWINIDAIPARISLGVLTVLTMTTQSSGSRQSLPRVSYIKAIDIWMTMCLLFVFAALLEFAIVNVLNRKEIRRMVTMRARGRCQSGSWAGDVEPAYTDMEAEDGDHQRGATYIRDPYGKQRARHVDKVARYLFPAVFVTFNAVYWATYALWSSNPVPTVMNAFR